MSEVDLKADVEAGLEAEQEVVEEVIEDFVPDWSEDEAAEAEAMGWIPPDRAKKLPEGKKYVGPKEFMERNPLYKKVKQLETSIGQLNDHHQKVSETEHKKLVQQYEDKISRLKAEKVQALDEADHGRVVEIDDEMRTTEKPVEAQPIDTVFKDWVKDNDWYEKDSFLRVEAEKTGAVLYSDKLYGEPLLEAVKAHLKEAYPNKFENPNRNKAPAVDSGNAAPKSKGSSVSVKDLTQDERTVYENLKSMKVFNTDDETQKYFREVIAIRD